MASLSIITTTYNRGYCIANLYNSLVKQDCQDFVWLVIDDGSTDDTRGIIESYIEEGLISIIYHYKENGGMHTARNAGYELADTPLNMIVDSDDWLADDAVSKILSYWHERGDERAAGMITLNADPSGQIVGTRFPAGVERCSYRDFFGSLGMRGDHKLIYRSDLTRKYPYPVFQNEKFYPASYKFYEIDKDYDLLLFDCVTCIVNYTDNSMTRNKYAQYKSCPQGFMHYRRKMLGYRLGIKEDTKNMLHYIMELSIVGGKPDKDIVSNPLYYACLLPGKLYYWYVMHTRRRY